MNYDIIISLLTLTLMEIILGIDNIIFISITSGKLPLKQQKKARVIGLSIALAMRILLLLSISWILQASETLFVLSGIEFNFQSLIFIFGGLFLLWKSTAEIYDNLELEHDHEAIIKHTSLKRVVIQIVLLDIVLSFDSILTAIGLVKHVTVMIAAVIIAVIIMFFLISKISNFINKHPSVKILSLSLLMLIGFVLFLEGLHEGIPKGFVYFTIFFSLLVEFIKMKTHKPHRHKPLILKKRVYKDTRIHKPDNPTNLL